MDEKEKKVKFLTNLVIVLSTIIVGLSSYIFYTSYTKTNSQSQICEYNGWAYSDGETFEAEDGCNTCTCNNGVVSCTEMACEKEESNTCAVGEDCE